MAAKARKRSAPGPVAAYEALQRCMRRWQPIRYVAFEVIGALLGAAVALGETAALAATLVA